MYNNNRAELCMRQYETVFNDISQNVFLPVIAFPCRLGSSWGRSVFILQGPFPLHCCWSLHHDCGSDRDLTTIRRKAKGVCFTNSLLIIGAMDIMKVLMTTV